MAGPLAGDLLQAARLAFVQAMGDALVIGAAIIAVGAVIVVAWLPSRPRPSADAEDSLDIVHALSDGGTVNPCLDDIA
jgi:hypothetical protein